MQIKLSQKILKEMEQTFPKNLIFEEEPYGFRSGKEIDTKYLSSKEVEALIGGSRIRAA